MIRGASKHQRGAAMVEYSVLSVIVVASLFLPLPGMDQSLVDFLLSALRQFQSNTAFLLSLP